MPAIQCCRWFRCSMPTAGVSHSPRPRWAPSWCCPAPSSTARRCSNYWRPGRGRTPTVWLMLLNHIAANNLKLPHLRMVVCGGSAMPRSMIKAFIDMGVKVRHAWGMTEMSPIGTLAALKPPFAELTGDARLDILQTQGYPPFGVQMKITDDANKTLPRDGNTV